MVSKFPFTHSIKDDRLQRERKGFEFNFIIHSQAFVLDEFEQIRIRFDLLPHFEFNPDVLVRIAFKRKSIAD